MNRTKHKDLFVSLVNDTLRVFPKERVTLEVLSYIKANKKEFVGYIQHVRKAFSPENMECLSNDHIAVKVHNLVLSRDVYFLLNGEISDLRSADGLISYIPSEVEYLIQFRVTAEVISKVNMVKKVFPESKIVWH